MRVSAIGACCVGVSLAVMACGGDEPAPAGDPGVSADAVAEVDGTGDMDAFVAVGDVGGDAEVAVPDTGVPAPGDQPEWFPDRGTAPNEWVELAQLEGPVRVIYDDLGIPHIYASTRKDLAFAQGYVTARHRLFQFHTLRMAASGRLAELLGADSLQGDVYLRILKLRRVAEQMAVRAETEHPKAFGLMQAFADGVNQWIGEVNADKTKAGMEVAVFGEMPAWTVADTMTVVRLQTWDLSFGGVVEADELFFDLQDLKERLGDAAAAPIAADLLDFTAPNLVSTMDTAAGKPGAGRHWDAAKVLADPMFDQIPKRWREASRVARATLKNIPHRAFRGGAEVYGSNNWVVSGAHTKSGKVLVNNDPHLALRNPAIFFQVHLDTTEAGGDFQVSGVQFAGAPGISLGTNGHIAWGGTVFFSDVTDVYLETLSADGLGVVFKGQDVPFEVRKEVFTYTQPGDGTCESAITGWMKRLPVEVKALGDYTCQATFDIWDVPHHGPVLPWTVGGPEGHVMSWRWTGFEPTDDLVAIMGMNDAKDWEGFKAALNQFGVGAQNWIYGDQAGNIGWYPSHLLPIRKNVADCQAKPGCVVAHPPFLPLPGDGSAEWDGFIPRDELPQLYNPKSGVIVTANSDPIGASFDGDVFNDGPYLGYFWAAGFRMARASERVEALAKAGDVTQEDMMAVQGDHRSNLGARLRDALVDALDEAEGGADWTDQMAQARELLKGWSLEAADGATAAVGSTEQKDSSATAIFNVWLTYMVERTFADEGLDGLGDHMLVRILLRMVEAPEAMAMWDEASGQAVVWDDRTTADHVETMNEVFVLAMADALTWLSANEQVGAGDAYGNPEQWRWGRLHTLRLPHNLLPSYDIPPAAEYPYGFTRPGDNFTVDACHPGMKGRDFSYKHGPAIRQVMEMVDPVVRHGVIPGGQEEDPRESENPPPHRLQGHYWDQMALWVANKAPIIPWTTQDVEAHRSRGLDLYPTPAK